jgi:hypothetical protein
MYFDFDDYRPDVPRMPTAMSVREAVLLSLVIHLLAVIAYLTVPEDLFVFERDPVQTAELVPPPEDRQPMRFVEIEPLRDLPELPERPADASDLDRRSATIERPENAIDPGPFMQGNTPEMVEGGPVAPPEPPPPPPPPAASTAEATDAGEEAVMTLADRGLAELTIPRPAEAAPQAETRELSDSLRNLAQHLRQENYDNRLGGDSQQSAHIQFDSRGVDFSSWLLRFKHQVERNWIVPLAAMTNRDHVVIRFFVQRNGYITDLEVVRPAAVSSLTTSAVNALRLSNPTVPLPPEYPADRMQILVTFFYNQDPRSLP